MSASLDLNLLALVREGGQDRYDLPGLYAVSPPRRPARGRASDHLVIYLTLSGNSPLPSDSQDQLLARLAQSYYKTGGTVTAAMRTVAFTLNQILLQRNVHSTRDGRQGIGLLTLAVLRNGTLYLGHSGPVHTYILGSPVAQEFYDTQSSGRGLGLSRTAPARYFQVKLKPGQFILFVHQPCINWTLEKLQPLPNLNIDSLRRHLQAQPDPEFNAVLVQVLEGTGRLRMMRPKTPISDMAHPVEKPQAAEPAAQPGLEKTNQVGEKPVSRADQLEEGFQPLDLAALPPGGDVLSENGGQPGLETLPVDVTAGGSAANEEAAGDKQVTASRQGIYRKAPGAAALDAPRSSRRKPSRSSQKKNRPAARFSFAPLGKILATIGAAGKHVVVRMLKVVLALLKSVLPDESVFTLPTSTMVFIALAVPLVIGIIGVQVYVQRGLAARQKVFFDQAVAAASYARTLTEPAEVRLAWIETLKYLDEAEQYKTTEDATALKNYARSELDRLDYIDRLDFLPAISSGLGDVVQVTQMVATTTELYLLNGARGNVLRAILTGDGYLIDPSFVCGPTSGPSYVGPLIDIVLMPKGVENDPVILGMDATGNMEYCIVDSQPLVPLVAPPGIYFGSPKALTIDGRDVYVLDPAKQAVWVYRDFGFGMQPRLFFGDEIPSIQDAIDLAVNNDDLYLLHADGHQTICTYSGFAAATTRCDEEVNYIDPRPGRSDGPVIPDSLFSQILFSPPPDPSLYLLDPGNQAIFHFSLRLNYQRQFRSQNELPAGPATAFFITPNRVALIAVGNHVFYATLP